MRLKINLQAKLQLIVTLVIVATLFVFYYLTVVNQKQIYDGAFKDSAIGLAQALDASISSTGELENTEKLQSNIYKLLWLSPNITGISISLPKAENLVTVASNETESIGKNASDESIASYKNGDIFSGETSQPDGTKIYSVITPVHVGGQRVGVYTIKLSLDALQKSINDTQRQFLSITVISILLMIAVLSVSLKKIVTDPLQILLKGMEQIGLGDLAHRVTSDRQDEIGTLFGSLNNMARQLQISTGEVSSGKKHIEVLFDTLADGVVEYSPAGEIRSINHAAERMLGIPHDSVIGKKILPSISEEEGLYALSRVIYPTSDEIDAQKKSGSKELRRNIEISVPLRTDLQIATVPLPDSAETGSGFVSVIRDITREKLIDQEKSNFITVAAHQLRTPLSATKWVLSSIIDDRKFEISEKVSELVKTGLATNNRMIDLVNDLLAVSRIEDGRYGFNFTEGNICELVDGIGAEYTPLIFKKTLSYSTTCSPDIPHLKFDASKLSIAIHGLIDNAIDYSRPGGKISVTVTREGENAVVKVSDNGIGIPKDSVPKLFSKFYRAENAILMSPNGSGLGLFIVKNIVTQHQGTISVESEENKGTTFTVRLPLHT